MSRAPSFERRLEDARAMTRKRIRDAMHQMVDGKSAVASAEIDSALDGLIEMSRGIGRLQGIQEAGNALESNSTKKRKALKMVCPFACGKSKRVRE